MVDYWIYQIQHENVQYNVVGVYNNQIKFTLIVVGIIMSQSHFTFDKKMTLIIRIFCIVLQFILDYLLDMYLSKIYVLLYEEAVSCNSISS